MAQARAHVVIRGKVQGVYYRYATREQAEMLGVKGWVKNRRDGTVEAVFEGDEEAVRRIIAWCHQGPPAARVTGVQVRWEEYRGEFPDFRIVYG